MGLRDIGARVAWEEVFTTEAQRTQSRIGGRRVPDPEPVPLRLGVLSVLCGLCGFSGLAPESRFIQPRARIASATRTPSRAALTMPPA